MVTVEIRVNGTIVAVMSAVRVEENHSTGVYTYDCSGCSFPIDRVTPPRTWKRQIQHAYNDGIEKLAQLLCVTAAKP